MKTSRTVRAAQTKPGSAAATLASSGRVESEIAALQRLNLDELRIQWRNRWGRLAPASLPRGLLFRVMAYRLQADAFGDLGKETARLLDRLSLAAAPTAAGIDEREATPSSSESGKHGSGYLGPPPAVIRGLPIPMVLKPGTLLTREWQGRVERVMALEKGFAWNGKTYESLSGLALAITGVKWSGQRFFFGSAGRAGTAQPPKGLPSDAAHPAKTMRQSKATYPGPVRFAAVTSVSPAAQASSNPRPNWRGKCSAGKPPAATEAKP